VPTLKRRIGVVAAVALAACSVALGHQDDSVGPREVGDAQISPDGSSVLFARAGAIWRVPYSGGEAQQVTTAKPLSGRARWSPDAKQIAFLHRDPGAAW
jgi:hypothetical protein